MIREQAVWAAGGFHAAMLRVEPAAGSGSVWHLYRRIRNMIQAAHGISDREAVVAARQFRTMSPKRETAGGSAPAAVSTRKEL